MYTSFSAKGAGLTLSAAATIELAARAGFEGVDLMLRDLIDQGENPRTLRARMDDLGLQGGAFPNPVRWRGEVAMFAHDLQRLPRQAAAAAELGLYRTSTWVLPETAPFDGPDPAREALLASVMAMHCDRLGAIARVLSEHGIRLGLEAIGVASSRTSKGIPFVTGMADLGRVLHALGEEHQNVGVIVDGWHLYAAGESVEAGLAWGVERIVCVHIANLPATASGDRAAMIDDHRGLPDENGAIDCRGLLERLEAAGYAGPVTAEPMPGCRSLAGLDAEAAARRIVAGLRAVCPSRRAASGPA